MQRKLIRVPRNHKGKFLDALGDHYMKSITDSEKIAYANSAMRREYIINRDMYEHFSIKQELEKHCPSLVDEWDQVVKTHGVIV